MMVYRREVLSEFLTELFLKTDMSREDAEYHAYALTETNLWGVDSHGVIRVPAYFRRMMNGAINTKPDTKTIKGSLGLEVIDGDDGSGFIVGKRAMERAVELAKEHNVGIVGAIRSNHFGASGLYAKIAAENNMVGIAMTNVLPLIVAPGASRPVVGNNPFAISIPTHGEFPFLLDMSLSKVAGGKLTLAIKKGEKIPTDWATDSEGKPTDDPQKAFEGFLLPMGEFKGLGLAYAVDILAGVITGGVFSHQMRSMYANPEDPSLTGHLMMAINIPAIIDNDEMKNRMSEYYERLVETPMWNGGRMYLPGELEYLKKQERLKDGIPLPKKTVEELEALAAEMNVKTPLARVE
ncbi:Ldh family oxidoreductase [Alkalibacter rhizosphaerae]|uniref:Ldh family oxidoreductase n=2 Tax=Alkalibacter rhizosphaerae TaxID=2815577 RepID=A0A974XH41_9FIRM|nr:Ldh family oxidoreductase [Alkalibacter rhizosphaerae]